MSYNTIDSVFVRQYADVYEALCEQKESKLLSTIKNIGSVTGSSFTVNIMSSLGDDFGTPTRFGETQYSEAGFASRLAVMNDFSNFTKFALTDLPKLKADPQDELLQRLHAKRNRKIDSIIYNALLGTAQEKTTLADTYTGIALPASQIVGDGTAPLTKQQLIDVKTKFMDNDVEGETIYLVYNSDVVNAILNDNQLTSNDYLNVKLLQNGDITDFLGFRWIPYNGIKAKDATVATGVAYVSSALQFGANQISPLKMAELESENRTQSLGEITSYGAIRTDEKKVVAFKFAV